MTGFLAKGGGRVSARQPTHFLLLRQEKVSKEKATQLSATPALRYGATCVGAFAGCAVELATRCALHSDNHGESDVEACVSCGTHATPQTPRHRRIQKGWPRAIAALGTQGRARSASSAQAERSDGPWGCWAAPNPFWMRRGAQGAGWRVCRRTHPHQHLACRSCLSVARSAQRVLRHAPRTSTPGCPAAQRRGRRQQGRLLFAYFLLAKQEKVSRPPGRDPASAPRGGGQR